MSVWTDLGMTTEPVEFSLAGLFTLLESVDVGVLGLVGAGVTLAWIGTFTVARVSNLGTRVVPIQRTITHIMLSLGTQAALLVGILAMFGMLCIATGVMLRTNETGLISIAGSIAVVATPLMVMFLEGVQVPSAQVQIRQAERAASHRESIPGLRTAA